MGLDSEKKTDFCKIFGPIIRSRDWERSILVASGTSLTSNDAVRRKKIKLPKNPHIIL